MIKEKMFKLGDRVCVLGDWEWPDGTTGTVSEPDAFMLSEPNDWQGLRKMIHGRKRIFVTYFIKFDQPQDDGSGDGPYSAGEVDENNLELIK